MKSLWSNQRWRWGSDQHSNFPQDLSKVHFVVLDTETTGFDPLRDRILSIGAVKLHQQRIHVCEAIELYLTQERFDQRSVPIHGILPSGRHQRVSEKEALVRVHEYLAGAVVVGHHIRFDMEMLRQACERQGLAGIKNPCLDTALLYRHTLLKTPLVPKKASYTLDELVSAFELSRKDRHTALGDAYITALAFLRIISLLEAKKQLTLKQLLKMGS